MAHTRLTVAGILTVIVVFLTTFAGVSAQAPAPSLDCTNNLLNLSNCLTYVEAGSNLTKPEKGCCPALAGLVESSPICLCELLQDPNGLGIPLNLKKAENLPSVCRVSTPPVSLCAVLGVPVGVPTSGGPMSPEGSISPFSPSGPTTAPSPESKNGASNIRDSALVFLVGFSSLSIAIFF